MYKGAKGLLFWGWVVATVHGILPDPALSRMPEPARLPQVFLEWIKGDDLRLSSDSEENKLSGTAGMAAHEHHKVVT